MSGVLAAWERSALDRMMEGPACTAWFVCWATSPTPAQRRNLERLCRRGLAARTPPGVVPVLWTRTAAGTAALGLEPKP